MEEAKPEKNWLTAEQKKEYELPVEENFYFGSTGKTIHRVSGLIAKRLDVSPEEQRERRIARKTLKPNERVRVEKLIQEDLDKTFDEASERERMLAIAFITGNASDRKLWFDYVTKAKGAHIINGQEVLPLEFDAATGTALVLALNTIKDLQAERHTQRMELLKAEEQAELDRGPEEDDVPF